MKKRILPILLAFVLLAILSLSVSAEATATYSIPKAKNAPTIDGVIGEEEWYGAETVTFADFGPESTASGGATRALGDATTIYMMWDDTNVYFAAFIEDATLSAANYCGGRNDWAVHWGDSVEVFTGTINVHKGYSVFPYDEWNPGNTATALIFNNADFTKLADKYNQINPDTIATAVSLSEDNSVMYHYVMEWSMPMSIFMEAAPAAGASFPLAFGLTNADIDTHVSNNPKLSFWNDAKTDDSGAVTNTAVLTDAVAGEKPANPPAEESPETADGFSAMAILGILAACGYVSLKKKH